MPASKAAILQVVTRYNTGLHAFSSNMSNATTAVVTPSAYLTLHYRLATADGTDLITTFGGNPATLMLGQGQLAPFLEDALIGMKWRKRALPAPSRTSACSAK